MGRLIVNTLIVKKKPTYESPLDNPHLKKPSFEVPENYFSGFAAGISDKITQLPVEENTSHPLPFSTPSGYFEQLPIAIQERVAPTRRIRKLYKPALALSLAAIMAGIFFLFRSGSTGDMIPNDLSTITVAELEASHLVYELDEEALAAAYAEIIPEITEEEKAVEDYLIENELDISLIDI